ncbi:FAD:protein FMN transferase [Thalassotalea sp. LPB0316]|uniref:FAD:protein FMN transferase n=1 Tax=Thalassotalea sp. LPB0316 TaxID=2769490 RepID=UPI001868C3DD|nr:FAD:protein FMN transferase [Thalassotalea sp. LPB0316]QOL27006.1 FAD:protein FMN transferase [Thalassotalea sp. LPB0316]
MRLVKLLSFLVVIALVQGCFPNNNDSTKEELLLQGPTMGTTYNIKFVIEKGQLDVEQLHQEIDTALVQVNQEMSTYIPDSELSLFNKSTGDVPVEMSRGLATVINESIRLGEMTEGKLDITIGPLVNLWGFGPQARPDVVPSDELLANTEAQTGLRHLVVSGNKISKTLPSLYVDLSTTAKGYGVDVIAELLEAKNIHNYLVEVGGEMRVKGFKANGTLWHIAIEKPITNDRVVHQIVVPQDNAVATSGDYRNYFEENGQRFSHIIDPDTGKPINHKLVSVTVIHPSAMTADGLSTAIMVMGPEQGLAFAQKHELAAMLIVKTDNGFEEINTVKFMPYLK